MSYRRFSENFTSQYLVFLRKKMHKFLSKRALTKTDLAQKVYKLGSSLIRQIQDMGIIFQKKQYQKKLVEASGVQSTKCTSNNCSFIKLVIFGKMALTKTALALSVLKLCSSLIWQIKEILQEKIGLDMWCPELLQKCCLHFRRSCTSLNQHQV